MDDLTQDISHVAPARCAADRVLAAQFRAAGLWKPLCRGALWQYPTRSGEPVHSESSALAQILSHTGSQDEGGLELGRRLLEAVGREPLAAALQRAGRRHIDRPAWLHWRRVLGIPRAPEDDDRAAFGRRPDGSPNRPRSGRDRAREAPLVRRGGRAGADFVRKDRCRCYAPS